MGKRRPIRKQRVVLRARHREELRQRVMEASRQLFKFLLGAGVLIFIVSRGDVFLATLLKAHTPKVDIRVPEALMGTPVALHLPAHSYWLWVPGVAERAGTAIRRKFPAVRTVRFEKDFAGNRIIVRLEPRKPIVQFNGSALDAEGVTFSLLPSALAGLPRAEFRSTTPKTVIGKWLGSLVAIPEIWSEVTAVRDDKYGHFFLQTKTGAEVAWGIPDADTSRPKALSLHQVLTDAHDHLGGAARADLRFFDEGRIIVKPKGR